MSAEIEGLAARLTAAGHAAGHVAASDEWTRQCEELAAPLRAGEDPRRRGLDHQSRMGHVVRKAAMVGLLKELHDLYSAAHSPYVLVSDLCELAEAIEEGAGE